MCTGVLEWFEKPKGKAAAGQLDAPRYYSSVQSFNEYVVSYFGALHPEYSVFNKA